MSTHLNTTFIVLSIGGLVNACYLVYKHQQKNKSKLICPLNHDCSKVTESKWSKIFFIKNEVLGAIFFLSMLILMLYSIITPNSSINIKLILLVGALVGLLFSIFLVLIQKFILKDYCFYCLISSFITLLLFIFSILIYIQ